MTIQAECPKCDKVLEFRDFESLEKHVKNCAGGSDNNLKINNNSTNTNVRNPASGTYVFTVPEIPPSANKYMGNSRSYHIYLTDKKRWHRLIDICSHGHGIKEPLTDCDIEITYCWKDKRRRDPGNFNKFILDGLTHAGIIKDDSFREIKKLTLLGKFGCEEVKTIIKVIAHE